MRPNLPLRCLELESLVLWRRHMLAVPLTIIALLFGDSPSERARVSLSTSQHAAVDTLTRPVIVLEKEGRNRFLRFDQNASLPRSTSWDLQSSVGEATDPLPGEEASVNGWQLTVGGAFA